MEHTKDDRQSRIFAGVVVLVLVWIGVYWMWEPGRQGPPRISVAQPTPDPEPADDEPRELDADDSSATDPDPSADRDDPEPQPGVIAPRFRSHTIRQGELFQDIADRYYGRRELWGVIARANPTLDPRRLREGMTVRVPLDPANIQGRPERSAQDEPDSAGEDLTIEYIVRPNDSLSLIAQRHYGSARYADLIYRANRDKLASRDAIRVGQVLALPPTDEGGEP